MGLFANTPFNWSRIVCVCHGRPMFCTAVCFKKKRAPLGWSTNQQERRRNFFIKPAAPQAGLNWRSSNKKCCCWNPRKRLRGRRWLDFSSLKMHCCWQSAQTLKIRLGWPMHAQHGERNLGGRGHNAWNGVGKAVVRYFFSALAIAFFKSWYSSHCWPQIFSSDTNNSLALGSSLFCT